jgi:hypothetical protein
MRGAAFVARLTAVQRFGALRDMWDGMFKA